MIAQRWEHYPHEADMGIRGFGDTKARAFAMAATALTAIITDLEKVKGDIPVTISCDAPDDELLLVDWLNALIYEMATRKMLFSQFEIQITAHHLQATARGEKVNVTQHQPAIEVKGATYTDVCVNQNMDGSWLAQCVVDV